MCIPEAVFEEVTANQSYQDEAYLIRNSNYIRVVSVRNTEQVCIIQRATGLDRGEAEAIVYADETKATLLLMDELSGRRVAQNMSIPISGSVGILVRAYQSGFLSENEVKEALKKIRESNRHISEHLIEDAIRIVEGNV